MATQIVSTGAYSWSGRRDAEGYREYEITFRVKGNAEDGPATVLATAGLPLPGSLWLYDNDADLWAWCRPDTEITPELEGEPNQYWKVKCKFSNKPLPPSLQRCNDVSIEDPLLEPQKVSGTGQNRQEEASHDRFGQRLTNSAWEQLHGPQVEFDVSIGQIRIEQNVLDLQLALCESLRNTVNESPLWGLPARCIKLSRFDWEVLYYGQCYKYYRRSFEFDINTETFDRTLLDEGTKVLNGKWLLGGTAQGNIWQLLDINGSPPDPLNPQHFIRYKDIHDENAKVILNGEGSPAAAQGLGVANIAHTTEEIIIDTSEAHNLEVGDEFSIQGAQPDIFNTDYVVAEVIDSLSVNTESFAPGAELEEWEGGGLLYIKGASVGYILVQKYHGADYLQLGVPTSF